MRFNYAAYEKVFPETKPAPVIESAVDTFKPTEAEAIEKAKDEMPGEDVKTSEPKVPEAPTTESAKGPEGENNG